MNYVDYKTLDNSLADSSHTHPKKTSCKYSLVSDFIIF